MKFSKLALGKEKPAASLCPPQLDKYVRQLVSAWDKSKSATPLRPEPATLSPT